MRSSISVVTFSHLLSLSMVAELIRVIAAGTLSAIDMKYGLGILVYAYQNPQMMCYVLGALELFNGIFDLQ